MLKNDPMTVTFPTIAQAHLDWANDLAKKHPNIATGVMSAARLRRERVIVTSQEDVNGDTVQVVYYPETEHYETRLLTSEGNLGVVKTLETTQSLDVANAAAMAAS
jgi:hypothetical protein